MIDFIIVAGAVIICAVVIIYRVKNKSCGCGKCGCGNCDGRSCPSQSQDRTKEDRH